jgi:hypothetical protein
VGGLLAPTELPPHKSDTESLKSLFVASTKVSGTIGDDALIVIVHIMHGKFISTPVYN